MVNFGRFYKCSNAVHIFCKFIYSHKKRQKCEIVKILDKVSDFDLKIKSIKIIILFVGFTALKIDQKDKKDVD